MVWWGWIIIVVVVALATGIVVYVATRKGTRQLLDREELLKQRERTAREQLAAEQQAREAIEAEAKQLARQLQANQRWYDNARRSLSKQVRDDYEKLAGDRAALDAKLDRLLADDTDPQRRLRPKPPPPPSRQR